LRRVTVWTITVVFKDGTVRSYDSDFDPRVAPGDIVVVAEGTRRVSNVDARSKAGTEGLGPTPMTASRRRQRRSRTAEPHRAPRFERPPRP